PENNIKASVQQVRRIVDVDLRPSRVLRALDLSEFRDQPILGIRRRRVNIASTQILQTKPDSAILLAARINQVRHELAVMITLRRLAQRCQTCRMRCQLVEARVGNSHTFIERSSKIRTHTRVAYRFPLHDRRLRSLANLYRTDTEVWLKDAQ